MKIMCLRNKTPEVRAILKLIGICLYHLYGYVAKWVRGRDGDSQTIHMLILYSVILHSVVCKGWASQAADSCLRKGMAAGTSLQQELLVPCVRFVVMVNYWTRQRAGTAALWQVLIMKHLTGLWGKSTQCLLSVLLGQRAGSEDKKRFLLDSCF